MFWAFKLKCVIDILAFFGLETAWATFSKLGDFFSNLLVTLPTVYDVERSLIQLNKIRGSELLGNERIGVLAVGQRQEVRLKI